MIRSRVGRVSLVLRCLILELYPDFIGCLGQASCA